MLDIKLIREDPEGVRAALERRGAEAAAALDGVIELDRRRRELLPELEGLRAEQNEANERIRGAADAARARARDRGDARGRRAREGARAGARGRRGRAAGGARAAPQPARPHAPRPAPRTSSCARSATPPELGFEPRDHLELAGEMIDTERGARLSGVALRLPARRARDARARARALGAREGCRATASNR